MLLYRVLHPKFLYFLYFAKIRNIAQQSCIQSQQQPDNDPVMPPDYSGQNLQGRSFEGKNLTGANFSEADIRGADFTDAILKGADFTGAKAGLQERWIIGLLLVSWLLSVLSGFLSIIIGVLISYILDPKNTQNFFIGIVSLFMVAVFVIVTIGKGLTAGTFAKTFVGAFAFAVAGPEAFGVAGTFVGAFAGTFAGAFAVAVARAVAGAGARAFGVTGAFAGAFAGGFAAARAFPGAGAGAFAGAGAGAGVIVLFNAYIGWRSLEEDEKEAWLRSFALAFAATGGTSFRDADLTDADFTSATLKNTDFRKANLTRTRFYDAKKLDFARVGSTILINLDVLNLLVTGEVMGKSYAGANLKGANLKGAKLKEANLKDANISQATFQDACLEGANLTLTQAINTDFTSAQMTRACIEAWNIESTTKLDNVDCRFVYLLENPKPETDDRERRPSSGYFQPGEFTKLFEEVLNTVDLIFRNGIDGKAFVTAFKKVQVENGDTELAIQSIENKDGVFVIKIKVPVDADKQKIHRDFTQKYKLALRELEKYKAQLQAKDNEIVAIYREQREVMIELVTLLTASKPQNVQVVNKNKIMTNSNDTSRKVEIKARDFNASGQALNLGEISGTVTNTINELPKSDKPEKPGIKELLTQLQATIEAETNLGEEDKAEALEQVKALAEAGKNPKEGAMQKSAKTAMKILKGTISSLPSAATLVEACGKLLPLISGFLGLG